MITAIVFGTALFTTISAAYTTARDIKDNPVPNNNVMWVWVLPVLAWIVFYDLTHK